MYTDFKELLEFHDIQNVAKAAGVMNDASEIPNLKSSGKDILKRWSNENIINNFTENIPLPNKKSSNDSKGTCSLELLGNRWSGLTVKVLDKIREKKTISYTDLAEEISGTVTGSSRNLIRRQILDTLVILESLGLVEQSLCNVSWKGTNKHPAISLQEGKRNYLLAELSEKKRKLQEMLKQTVALHQLAELNKENNKAETTSRVNLPFVIVSAPKDATMEIQMSDDQMDLFVNIDRPFEIYDDTTIISKIAPVTKESAQKALPENLVKYMQFDK